MNYLLGNNCHIKLSHPLVNGGAAVGFILEPPGVKIERKVYTDGTGERVWVSFDVLLADRLLNPDGSRHTDPKTTMYGWLMDYLTRTSGISLELSSGVITGLGAVGFTAEEEHAPDSIKVHCQVNNAGFYVPPIDPVILYGSLWDGGFPWGIAVWRSL